MKAYQLIHTATQVISNTVIIDCLDQYSVPPGYSLVEIDDRPDIFNAKGWTVLQFKRRFTAQERLAIRSSANPLIQDYLDLLDIANDVRPTDPDTLVGVYYLESQGLIAPGRALEILTPP